MQQPTFDGSVFHPVHPLREWIRRNIPPGQAGYVVEDLDLILLRFGPCVGRDYKDDGQFILCELKGKADVIPYAQKRVFGLLDKLLRKADPEQKYYLGFYRVSFDWSPTIFKVNGVTLSIEAFQKFLLGEQQIKPLNLGEGDDTTSRLFP